MPDPLDDQRGGGCRLPDGFALPLVVLDVPLIPERVPVTGIVSRMAPVLSDALPDVPVVLPVVPVPVVPVPDWVLVPVPMVPVPVLPLAVVPGAPEPDTAPLSAPRVPAVLPC